MTTSNLNVAHSSDGVSSPDLIISPESGRSALFDHGMRARTATAISWRGRSLCGQVDWRRRRSIVALPTIAPNQSGESHIRRKPP